MVNNESEIRRLTRLTQFTGGMMETGVKLDSPTISPQGCNSHLHR